MIDAGDLQSEPALQFRYRHNRTRFKLSLHSSLRATPLATWQESMSRLASPVRKPVDPTEFFSTFFPAVSRQVRRDGIHLWNIRYWNDVLSPWAGRMQRPLLVKYDPRDLSTFTYAILMACTGPCLTRT